MRRAGPALRPALALLSVGAVLLLLGERQSLRLIAALLLLAGVALAVFAVATHEFLSADRDEQRP
jgi:drug/metabolite transporter (DMT)-like permease